MHQANCCRAENKAPYIQMFRIGYGQLGAKCLVGYLFTSSCPMYNGITVEYIHVIAIISNQAYLSTPPSFSPHPLPIILKFSHYSRLVRVYHLNFEHRCLNSKLSHIISVQDCMYHLEMISPFFLTIKRQYFQFLMRKLK